MRLNPFRREKALTATGSAVSTLRDPGFNPFPLLGGGAQQRIQEIFNRAQSANYGWMYANSPAVRTVIDVIVRNVGQLELRLYEEVSEADRQPRPDHPAAMSLRYPNETSTADGFVRSMFKDFLIYDNAYALLIPAANSQLSLVRVPAYMVEVVSSSLFVTDIYRVWPQGAWTSGGVWGGAGTPIEYTPDQVMHWHGEHPLDPRVGLSKLDTLRDVVAEDASLQQATVELANAGLQEPAWVFRPADAPPWKNETLHAFEEDMAARLKGRNRKPVVLEEGMELRSFGVSPQDAQVLDVRRFALQRVASAFGLPLAIVGLGTGRAENLADAQAQLYTDTLLPYCEDFSKMLDQRILVRVYNWTDGTFEFNFDEKLMGNDRLTALTSASGRPVMTTDEARAKLDLPPVPGGGELVTPANVIVGSNPKPSPQIMPIQDPNSPPQDGSHRTPPKALTAPENAAVKGWEPRHKADIARQHRYVDEVAGLLERFYARQARSLFAKGAVKGFESDRWDKELATDLEGLVSSIVDREGGLYVARLAGDDFDMRQVDNYLKAMASGTAEGINRVTKADIDELGAEQALARARGQRAQVAAASIGTRATVFARTEAAKQAPNPERRTKTWIADSERHASLDGTTVPLDKSFGAIEPGSEIGCRCSMSIS